jgi:hypothetical protein
MLSAAAVPTLISVAIGVYGIGHSCIQVGAARKQFTRQKGLQIDESLSVCGIDNVFCNADIVLVTGEYLEFQEMAKLHVCQRKFHEFDVRHISRKLAVVGRSHDRTSAIGLNTVLQAKGEGSIDYAVILEALFRQALNHGGCLNTMLGKKDGQGRSLLQVAVQSSCRNGVKALLALGASADYGDSASGWSPLMYAIANGDLESAKLLVARGASVNFRARPHGWTPLVVAVAGNRLSLVEWLLDCGADAQLTIKRLKSHFSPGQLDVLIRIVEGRRKF